MVDRELCWLTHICLRASCMRLMRKCDSSSRALYSMLIVHFDYEWTYRFIKLGLLAHPVAAHNDLQISSEAATPSPVPSLLRAKHLLASSWIISIKVLQIFTLCEYVTLVISTSSAAAELPRRGADTAFPGNDTEESVCTIVSMVHWLCWYCKIKAAD